MTCEECGSLGSHEFRSPDDMLHAVQTAAQEVDRGVLRRIGIAGDLAPNEQAAIESAHESGSVPGTIRYRFECVVCGERFELVADTERGTGGWRSERSSTSGGIR